MDPNLADIHPLDTLMGGMTQVTSVYLIDAPETTLIETGPQSSAKVLAEALQEAGIAAADLAHVVLTHIHLDHAGGAGTLAAAFPNARFWIHEDVARHLVDPTRLIASAARIYGHDELRSLFGLPRPMAAERIHALREGTEIDIGSRRLRALLTPGHAASHVAIHDLATDTIFTGDAVGVHLPDPDLLRPAAPPPEFDLPAAVASIQRIRSDARGALLFAHFGPVEDVEGTCDAATETLLRWSDAARRGVDAHEDAAQIQAALAELEDTEGIEPDDERRLELMGSYRLNALGMERYWRKRREREAP